MSSTRDDRRTAQDGSQGPADEPRRALVLLFGAVRTGRCRFALGAESVQLGREVDPERHIQLDDSRASRVHAEILWSELHRAFWIRDLASRNGVHVNGVKVAREILKDGDVLRIGETIFRLAPTGPGPIDTAVALDPPFVGASQSLRGSVERAVQVASIQAPVLILGPTGAGKELIAETIHRASGRTGPLMPINCAALPSHLVESELFGHEKGAFSGADAARPGLFRAAHEGTVFLDEVGELAGEIQAKLLRVLDARSIRPVGALAETPVNVRVVAATNRDLAGEVAARTFRGDLYARLAEVVVRLDPLCERPEDLLPLWQHFAAQLGHGAELALSGAAFEAMALHAWPFNVRELRQLVRHALLLKPTGGTLTVDDLPEAFRQRRPEQHAAAAQVDARVAVLLSSGEIPSARQLRQLIEEFRGSVKEVAAFLGKDRKQIYRWLQRHRIDPDAYRRGGS